MGGGGQSLYRSIRWTILVKVSLATSIYSQIKQTEVNRGGNISTYPSGDQETTGNRWSTLSIGAILSTTKRRRLQQEGLKTKK